MGLILFILFLIWLYKYLRFTGKRRYCQAMVVVAMHCYKKSPSRERVLELASAYMQVHQYKTAHKLFASALTALPKTGEYADVELSMRFCERPLPWSDGLRDQDMGYWHDLMLTYLGGRHKVWLFADIHMETEVYLKSGRLG